MLIRRSRQTSLARRYWRESRPLFACSTRSFARARASKRAFAAAAFGRKGGWSPLSCTGPQAARVEVLRREPTGGVPSSAPRSPRSAGAPAEIWRRGPMCRRPSFIRSCSLGARGSRGPVDRHPLFCGKLKGRFLIHAPSWPSTASNVCPSFWAVCGKTRTMPRERRLRRQCVQAQHGCRPGHLP